MPNFPKNPDGAKPSGFKLRSTNKPQFKNMGATSPMPMYKASPAREDGGTTNANVKVTKPKKKTLGEWFKSTKLGDDLNKAGKQIKGDVDKVKSKTEAVTDNIKSTHKKNVEKIKTKKKNLETRKSNFDTKVKKNVGGLLDKLFIKKKKKTSPATKKKDPKKKKATLNLDYIQKGFEKASNKNFDTADKNYDKATKSKSVLEAAAPGYGVLGSSVAGALTHGAANLIKDIKNIGTGKGRSPRKISLRKKKE
mgnify:CR=1 FL=1